jgi:sugar phosphate isomerase/epimerase
MTAPHVAATQARGWSIARSRLSGIGDEAGPSIQSQIRAHQRLGWKQLELRSVDRRSIGELDGDALARVADTVHAEGLEVRVLASRLGNWASSIADNFACDYCELVRLLGFAQRLGAPFIRVMSYGNGGRTADEEWGREARRRIVELSRYAADRGVTLLHENCHGWAARDPERALSLIKATEGRGLALLFDVGNPVAHGYDAIAYLRSVLSHVAHIHVKDAITMRPGGETQFTFPGEGAAPILECIDMAIQAGYEGAISIEPHIAAIPHLGVRAEGEAAWEAYIAYGRRFMELLGARLAAPPVGGSS